MIGAPIHARGASTSQAQVKHRSSIGQAQVKQQRTRDPGVQAHKSGRASRAGCDFWRAHLVHLEAQPPTDASAPVLYLPIAQLAHVPTVQLLVSMDSLGEGQLQPVR